MFRLFIHAQVIKIRSKKPIKTVTPMKTFTLGKKYILVPFLSTRSIGHESTTLFVAVHLNLLFFSRRFILVVTLIEFQVPEYAYSRVKIARPGMDGWPPFTERPIYPLSRARSAIRWMDSLIESISVACGPISNHRCGVIIRIH